MNSLYKAIKIKMIEYAIDLLFDRINNNLKQENKIKLKIGDIFEEIIVKDTLTAFLDCKITDLNIQEKIAVIAYKINANISPVDSSIAYYIETLNDYPHRNDYPHMGIINIETAIFNKIQTIEIIEKVGTVRRISDNSDEFNNDSETMPETHIKYDRQNIT